MIIDTHCHVIVAEMTAGTVPEHWRPAVSRAGGHYRLGFRGREINSVTAEFTDVTAMLAEAAGTGVGHLLLSPWINLVPVDAEAQPVVPASPAHHRAPLLRHRASGHLGDDDMAVGVDDHRAAPGAAPFAVLAPAPPAGSAPAGSPPAVSSPAGATAPPR